MTFSYATRPYTNFSPPAATNAFCLKIIFAIYISPCIMRKRSDTGSGPADEFAKINEFAKKIRSTLGSRVARNHWKLSTKG